MIATADETVVYSSGLCCCSVCTTLKDPSEVEAVVNRINPAGCHFRWKVSSEPFKSGEPNPKVCENDPDRLHFLLTC